MMSQSKKNFSISCAKKTFSHRKVFSSCADFVLSIQRWKRMAIKFSTIISKQTAKARSSGCWKHEQNKVWAIWWFNDNLMRTWLPIKTHIDKLKMMKHQEQNIPMKMIQKTQKQTKHMQFPTLCQKYYQMMKSKRV